MKISELEVNAKVSELKGELSCLGEVKDSSIGKKVQEGILADDSGQVKITLWDLDAGKFKDGDNVILKNGWCKNFPTDSIEKQISAGRFGRVLLL